MTSSGAFGGPTVGVLALQGGVAEHVELLETLGARVAAVRTPRDLIGSDGVRVDALVLPGGESSVIDRLLRTFELFEPLREAIVGGLPTLATCAGLILLAEEVLDPAPGQQSLHVVDITVRRNAFGPQVASSVESLETTDGPVSVAFIRAPEVVRTGPGVAVVARRGPAIVAVRQRAVTGLAFHPELTGETRFHRQLLGQVEASARAS
jgi:pyridoxal 5'-phosphate synthase pdxT subunit